MPDKFDTENSCLSVLNNNLNDFIHTKSKANVNTDKIVNKNQNMKPFLKKEKQDSITNI